MRAWHYLNPFIMQFALARARLTLLFLLLVGTISSLPAQENASPKDNYRDIHPQYYASRYDHGYVTLRDGTRLVGQISIQGPSFEHIKWVKNRTTSGEKYNFQVRSLIEYGLDNTTINETPQLFSWAPKKQNTGSGNLVGLLSLGKMVGFADYGYVNMIDGKKLEGEITLETVNVIHFLYWNVNLILVDILVDIST